MTGIFERDLVLGWRAAPKDSPDFAAAIAAGQKAGAQAGIKAGYVRGLSDGVAKAGAAAKQDTGSMICRGGRNGTVTVT